MKTVNSQEKIGDITQLLWGSGLEYRIYSKVEKLLYNTVEELYPEVVDYRQEFIKLVYHLVFVGSNINISFS